MMTRNGPLDVIGRKNLHCAKNQDGGRPLPEVVYISVKVRRRMMGIVLCELERRALFQENCFRLCQSTSGMDIWGDDAAFCQITLTSCYQILFTSYLHRIWALLPVSPQIRTYFLKSTYLRIGLDRPAGGCACSCLFSSTDG